MKKSVVFVECIAFLKTHHINKVANESTLATTMQILFMRTEETYFCNHLFSSDYIYAIMDSEKEVPFMANTLIQFRADEAERTEATRILQQLGLDMPSYLRMCLSRLVSEKGIPFSMTIKQASVNKGIEAMKRASRIAEENGISDMALEEINAEIAEARRK